MKIIATSDLHGDLPNPELLPKGDILVIAGDILPDDYNPTDKDRIGTSRTMRQGWWFDRYLIPWLTRVKNDYKKVLWIAGNHDFFLDAMKHTDSIHSLMPEGVVYLNEEVTEVDGIKFYGAPWNGTRGWAFCLDEEEHAQRSAKIPPEIDVLIVHGPPGIPCIEELTWYCSPALGLWVMEQKPKLVICGHVHESYGEYKAWDTKIHVVSRKSINYRDVNPFVEIDIEKRS